MTPVPHFICPACAAEHNRGWVNGVDIFRCLRCGYTGFGHHADAAIDSEIERDAREGNEWDHAHGISEAAP